MFSNYREPSGKIGFRSCDRLLSFYDKLCELTSALPGNRIVPDSQSYGGCLFTMVCCCFCASLFHAMKNKTDNRRKQRGFSLLVCIVIAGSICGCEYSIMIQKPSGDCSGCWTGDCIFYKRQGGKKMLVDGGAVNLVFCRYLPDRGRFYYRRGSENWVCFCDTW